jgi:hypothetical protein
MYNLGCYSEKRYNHVCVSVTDYISQRDESVQHILKNPQVEHKNPMLSSQIANTTATTAYVNHERTRVERIKDASVAHIKNEAPVTKKK